MSKLRVFIRKLILEQFPYSTNCNSNLIFRLPRGLYVLIFPIFKILCTFTSKPVYSFFYIFLITLFKGTENCDCYIAWCVEVFYHVSIAHGIEWEVNANEPDDIADEGTYIEETLGIRLRDLPVISFERVLSQTYESIGMSPK